MEVSAGDDGVPGGDARHWTRRRNRWLLRLFVLAVLLAGAWLVASAQASAAETPPPGEAVPAEPDDDSALGILPNVNRSTPDVPASLESLVAHKSVPGTVNPVARPLVRTTTTTAARVTRHGGAAATELGRQASTSVNLLASSMLDPLRDARTPMRETPTARADKPDSPADTSPPRAEAAPPTPIVRPPNTIPYPSSARTNLVMGAIGHTSSSAAVMPLGSVPLPRPIVDTGAASAGQAGGGVAVNVALSTVARTAAPTRPGGCATAMALGSPRSRPNRPIIFPD